MRLDVRIAAPETSQPSNASQLRSLRSRWSLCPGREPSLSGAEFFVNEAMSVTALRHRRGRQPGRLGARDVGGRARPIRWPCTTSDTSPTGWVRSSPA